MLLVVEVFLLFWKKGAYKGVEAVIDKDRTAALLAKLTMADTLMILTAVEKVFFKL